MSTQPLRPPTMSEHESQLRFGPLIMVDHRTIETPHGDAGGYDEFCRAKDIIEGTTR